jgi:hypothetical protein
MKLPMAAEIEGAKLNTSQWVRVDSWNQSETLFSFTLWKTSLYTDNILHTFAGTIILKK